MEWAITTDRILTGDLHFGKGKGAEPSRSRREEFFVSLDPNNASDLDALEADDLAFVHDFAESFVKLREQIGQCVIGQRRVIEQLIIAMFCRGHCILEGAPGLAKTLTVNALARAVSMSFARIQFTPDLMPSDITGTEVIHHDRESGERILKFVRGPIFANVVLADEINRTPPKTQSALLEAMQERQITVGGATHPLPDPFFVLATQNPIEQEGTYPLPEAQLDRFMFKILVDYPTEGEELRIMQLSAQPQQAGISAVLTTENITKLQRIVARVPCAEHIMRYAMAICRATRPGGVECPGAIAGYLSWGAGPRASQHLIQAAQAQAVLNGRFYVSAHDIRAVAHPVLRHRLILSYGADADGVSTDDVIDMVLERVAKDASGIVDPAIANRVIASGPPR